MSARTTLAVLALGLGLLPAQTAPGFSVAPLWTERSSPLAVRGFAFDPLRQEHLLALGGTLFRQDPAATRTTLLQLPAGDDIAALVHEPGSTLVHLTALRSGTLYVVDLVTGAIRSAAGVANVFDLTALPSGAVLASANPTWPAPGANSGVWLLGAAAPRELIRLRGPSGPLLALPDGSLLVAELGPVVPPPPGSVHVLHYDAGRIAAAIAGGPPLGSLDGRVVVAGLDGAFDLAADSRGRLYVTDAGSGLVQRTRPAGGVLDPQPLAGVPGSALQLELLLGAAPMLPWQPEDFAESLLVSSSDFASEFRLQRVGPARPELLAPLSPVVPGPVPLGIRRAPASGLAVLAFGFSPLQPERVVTAIGGIPIWLALDGDPLAPIATTTLVLDSAGSGQLRLQHPGGFGFRVHLQALVLRTTGGLAAATTAAQTLTVLP